LSKQAYHPARGDIIHCNFSPASGREFALRHYAVVISTLAFSKATGMCIVLPLTTKYHHDKRLFETQLMVEMPPVKGLTERGWVYTHQIKTIDYREREASLQARLEDEHLDFLIDVMERARALIDPDSVT
jgi:mRNA-degrading endonuclease toxin of MazEF toxin-antitoxin module